MDEPIAHRSPPPAGPFIEVPYRIHRYWIGVPMADVIQHRGFPPAVRQFVRPEECRAVSGAMLVSGWQSYSAYCAATGVEECPTGRAWLDADQDAKLRFHSGTWSSPRRSSRGRWLW